MTNEVSYVLDGFAEDREGGGREVSVAATTGVCLFERRILFFRCIVFRSFFFLPPRIITLELCRRHSSSYIPISDLKKYSFLPSLLDFVEKAKKLYTHTGHKPRPSQIYMAKSVQPTLL